MAEVKVVDLVYYDVDGKRHVVGTAAVGKNLTVDNLVIETHEGDISSEVTVFVQVKDEYRHMFSVPAAEFSIGGWAQEVERRSCLEDPKPM